MKRLLSWLLALVAVTAGSSFGVQARRQQLMSDSGFESLTAGVLASTGRGEGWEIQRQGRDVIRDRLVAACIEDAARAKSGKKCLTLSIPKDTVGFEFVTVGQRHKLPKSEEVEASVWVRWPVGPDQAPAGASATSGHPSAIVSFWARHRDGTGDFAGRDDWLFDNRWTRLSFRLRATDPDQRTLVYVSLLPNQKPVDTTILVDDFELATVDDPSEADPRVGNVVRDSGFDAQKEGAVAAPWFFANMGGTGIRGAVVDRGAQRFVALSMGRGTSNFESAQLWQHIALSEGTRYEIAARLRWENYTPEAPAPIVNYGIFHEASRTWYGPVDQVLEKSGDWKTYRFTHVPPYGGPWKLYVQLNGWGNFGNGVSISVDDVTCTPWKRGDEKTEPKKE
jgi:hypothetical protein